MGNDLIKQNYQAECDRTLKGMTDLIGSVKSSISTCQTMATDYRPDDLLKESAVTIEKATRRVWEMKHFVRGQLLSANEDAIVKNLESDDDVKGLKTLIPYRTRGGMTSYARKLHGSKARQPKRRQSALASSGEEEHMMTEEEAAIILQTVVRVRLALNRMLAQVAMNYQKVWNWKYMRYYYVNLRSMHFDSQAKTGTGAKSDSHYTQWKKPPAITKHNEHAVLTPRSYHDMYNTSECADLEFTTRDPERQMMVGNYPTKKTVKLFKLGQQELPPTTETITTTTSDEAEAEPSSVLVVASGSGAVAISSIKRGKKMSFMISQQKKRMKERVLIINMRAKQLLTHQEMVERRGGVTREEGERNFVIITIFTIN